MVTSQPIPTLPPEGFVADAMVMAAGLGRRLRPFTDSLPKPMVSVAGAPLIEYSLRLLKRAGIERLLYNTHYLPHKVEQHMAAQSGLTSYALREQDLLETGGGMVRALPWLKEHFFALNSDVICVDEAEPVLRRMQAHWRDEMMDALLLVVPVERAVGYDGVGDFSLSPQGQLQPVQPGKPAYVFTGVQLLHQRFFVGAPKGAFSLSLLYRQALARSDGRLAGLVHQGSWYHVGDPAARTLAEQQLSDALACV